MRYQIQEGEFNLPDILHDQTVNIFTITDSGPSPFNLVITRSSPRSASLSEHVKAEIDLMAQSISGFEILWQRTHQIGGKNTVIVAAKTNGPNGPMEQRLIFCIPEERKSLTITATASPSFTSEQLDFLNEFSSSFTFNV